MSGAAARHVGTTSLAALIRIGRKSRDACDNQVIDDSLPSGQEPGINSDRSHFNQPWCQCVRATGDTVGIRYHKVRYPWQAQTNLVVRSKYAYEADSWLTHIALPAAGTSHASTSDTNSKGFHHAIGVSSTSR